MLSETVVTNVVLVLFAVAMVAVVWDNLKPSKKEVEVVAPVVEEKVEFVAPVVQVRGFHGVHDVLNHIVGDGYTVFYGEYRGLSCGIADTRERMIVKGNGYTFCGNHFWGADDYYMFPS